MFGNGRSQPGAARRAFVAVLACLALLFQAVAAPAHHHAPVPRANLQDSGSAGGATEHAAAESDHHRVCAICDALAHANAIAPPPAGYAALTVAANLEASATRPAARHTTQSHFWRSRGPPALL